ncbi:MAG: hypothetical protein HZB36_01380 [Candidatus Omnitrophica bacterium]|nr:hypothetical protein [Candidatus Omnitrophota bacterium]
MKNKIIVWVVVCALMGLDLAPSALAQTSQVGPSGPASAQVPQFLEFSLKVVKQMESATFNPAISPFNQGVDVSASPSFDFGNLSPVYDTNPASPTYGQFLFMRGRYFYYVLMIASTSGRRYKITEKGQQLVGPSGALMPNEAVFLVPEYQWQDLLGGVIQGAPPGSAFLGPVVAATSTTGTTEQLVYQSDNSGLGRIVRAIVAISGPLAGDTKPSNWSLGINGTSGQGTKQTFASWKPVTPDQVSGAYSGTITFTLTLN